jgi:hypothetical protein
MSPTYIHLHCHYRQKREYLKSTCRQELHG